MVVATLDLYERILARLPPAALRDSCNGVLRREVDDVHARLKEAAEAFGRLKEVETAVTQLQQDKEDRRRSASLMALIADTESVQRRLSKELKRMGRSISVGDTAKAVVASGESAERGSQVNSKTNAGSETESDDEDARHRKSKKRAKDSKDRGPKRETGASSSASNGQPSGVLELAQSCLSRVSDDSLPLKELQVAGVGTLKIILQRLVQGGDQVEAATQVAEAALDCVAKRFSREKNPNVNRIKKLVAAISEACAARPSLRSYVFRAQAQLESVLLEAKSSPGTSAKLHSSLMLAQEVDELPNAEKYRRLREVMASIQSSIPDGTTEIGEVQVLILAVKLVANWVVALPTEQLSLSPDLGAYHAFCDAMLDVANKNPKPMAGKGLARHAGRLKMAVTSAEMFEQRKNDHDSGSSLKTEGRNTSDSAGIAGSGSKFDGLQPALELARTLRKLRSVKERHGRLPELMDAVVDALPRIPEASIIGSTGPFLHIVRQMMSWVDERPIDPQMLARYDRFYKSATRFSYHITDGNTRTGFYRKVGELHRKAISKSAEVSPEPAPTSEDDPVLSKGSNKRGHDDAVASVSASNAVAEALEQVNTWQDGIFSLQQLDKVIKSVGRVIDDHRHNSAWNPLTDESVQECIGKLRTCVEGIKKDDHRAKRLGILDAWGVGKSGRQARGICARRAKSRGARAAKRKMK